MSRVNQVLLDAVKYSLNVGPLPDPPPPPCLWVQDLDDVLSASGQLAVAAIRSRCDCAECRTLRGEKVE